MIRTSPFGWSSRTAWTVRGWWTLIPFFNPSRSSVCDEPWPCDTLESMRQPINRFPVITRHRSRDVQRTSSRVLRTGGFVGQPFVFNHGSPAERGSCGHPDDVSGRRSVTPSLVHPGSGIITTSLCAGAQMATKILCGVQDERDVTYDIYIKFSVFIGSVQPCA